MKKIASFVLFLLLFVWISFYVKNHLSEFKDIRNLSLSYIFILIFFSFMYFVSQGLIFRTIVEPFGIKLKFKEWFGIIMVTLMGNYLVPFGGLGFRARYLKRIHSFSYTRFISTLGAIYLIKFLIFTLGGSISLGFLYFHSRILYPVVTGLLAVVLLSSISIILFFPKLPQTQNKILRLINTVSESWHRIKSNHKLIKRLLWLTFVQFLLVSCIFYFGFHSLNFNIFFINTFLVACLSDYSLFIRILPASFGFYEGAVVYSARLFNLTVAQGLLVVAMIRVVSLLLIFTLGPLYFFILTKPKPITNK